MAEPRLVDRRYLLSEPALGSGMFGAVYRAEQRALDIALRSVAVKLFDPTKVAKAVPLSELLKEALSLIALIESCDDPVIRDLFVACLDAGIEEGLSGKPYVVMELVRGGDLAHRIDGRPMPVTAVAAFALQIGQAVAFLHEHNFLHRDLKPANVLITRSERIKVGDFGLAIATSEFLRRAPSAGDLAYQPPEAIAFHDLGPTADVYSAGLIFYEMLTGALPFQHELNDAIRTLDIGAVVALKRRDPPPPSTVNRQLKEFPQLEQVVLRAMAMSSVERYSDGKALLDAVRAALRGEAMVVEADPATVALQHVKESRAARRRGDVASALDAAHRALACNEELPDERRVACAQLALVEALWAAGARAEAKARAQAAFRWRPCRVTRLAMAEAHRDDPGLRQIYRQQAGTGADPCP